MANRLNVANIGYNDATDALTIDSSGNITASGTVTTDTVDINGGNIDGTTIATSDITVGSGKTLDVSAGTLTLADNQISGDKVEGGTIAATTITSLTTGTISEAVTNAGVSIDGVVAKDSKLFAPSGIVFASAEITGDDAGTTNRVESSNLLDDYEEGSWTPTLTSSGTEPTVNTPYSSRVGKYTKVGNLLYVTCYIRAQLTNAGTGSPRVSGLPFDTINGFYQPVYTGLITLLNSGTDSMPYSIGGDYVQFDSSGGYIADGGNRYLCFSAVFII